MWFIYHKLGVTSRSLVIAEVLPHRAAGRNRGADCCTVCTTVIPQSHATSNCLTPLTQFWLYRFGSASDMCVCVAILAPKPRGNLSKLIFSFRIRNYYYKNAFALGRNMVRYRIFHMEILTSRTNIKDKQKILTSGWCRR